MQKKEKIDREMAWEINTDPGRGSSLEKGKKLLSLEPESHKEEILKAVMGRSGNLRAPAIKTKKAFFIGYNDTIYGALEGS